MGFFSTVANRVFGSPSIPCVCPVNMLDQLKKLIPPVPKLPEIPVPKLDALAPICTAAPTTANNFIAQRLNIINKMRIPAPLLKRPIDPVAMGQLESAAPLLRTFQRASGMKISDPKFAAAMQGSLLGLVKIPLPPIPAPPPPPPPVIQKVSAVVTQMRMTQANLSVKLAPLDPRALAKIQVAAKIVATIPPFPAEQLAPLAPVATLMRVTNAMGIDLVKPGAMVKFAQNISMLAKLPPAPKSLMPALPAMMNILSIAQVYDNVAAFFKLDLRNILPPAFIAKIGVPLQPLVKFAEDLALPLSPAQVANAQGWASAASLMPALHLLQNFDLGRLDLAPLSDLPDLTHVGVMNNIFTLGEAAKKSLGNTNSKCSQCPLR